MSCIFRCKNQLHIVLTMSPIGDSFRNRLRKFPSLVNCCTIDWFQVTYFIDFVFIYILIHGYHKSFFSFCCSFSDKNFCQIESSNLISGIVVSWTFLSKSAESFQLPSHSLGDLKIASPRWKCSRLLHTYHKKKWFIKKETILTLLMMEANYSN